MFLMWANKSLPAIAAAKFVESDKGDILSPKTAPEIIAPAVKAGEKPIALPIPNRAIPIVEMVVNPLPMAEPTKEQTIKTEGRKKEALISRKPTNIKAGITPA